MLPVTKASSRDTDLVFYSRIKPHECARSLGPSWFRKDLNSCSGRHDVDEGGLGMAPESRD
jgi:hypothetical protein